MGFMPCWLGQVVAKSLGQLAGKICRVVCADAVCGIALLLSPCAAGFVWQTAENEWGHAVIATALSVTDDTALTGKSILGELKVSDKAVAERVPLWACCCYSCAAADAKWCLIGCRCHVCVCGLCF